MPTTTNYVQGIEEGLIEKAKDFIWNHLDENDKRMAIHVATSNQLKDLGKKIDKIILGYTYCGLV